MRRESSCTAVTRVPVSANGGIPEFLWERTTSGTVRDDLYDFAGALVSSYTFGTIDLPNVDPKSASYGVGQWTSLGLGGSGVVRATYVGGMRLASAYAVRSGSEAVALGMAATRNAIKWTNPTMWFSPANRAAHMVPATERLALAGSAANLAAKVGTTNPYVNAAVVPLAPFIGVFGTDWSDQ